MGWLKTFTLKSPPIIKFEMSTRKECIRAASSFTLCTSNINVAGVCFPARYVHMRYVAKVGVGIPKRLIYYEFQLTPTMVSISAVQREVFITDVLV